jgi:polysaccharide pyruvyl transferase WcaK-like protein
MNEQVLVVGWYGKNNVGDDLFEEAFKRLFPQLRFSFTDQLTAANLAKVPAVFFGGGSFLGDDPHLSLEILDLLKTKKLFYISVGVETDIHPTHQGLMQQAKLIATRSADWSRIIHLNSNIIYIPDIVYALSSFATLSRQPKSVLVLPNAVVSPQWNEEQWKHTAWEHFKVELAQFLDNLISDGYQVNFFPMCQNRSQNDNWAAAEILVKMQHRTHSLILDDIRQTSRSLLSLFASYEAVITQRYHGIVLSEIAKTPYLSIHHHDKLKSSFLNAGEFTSYYGVYKDSLAEQYKKLLASKVDTLLPLERHMFRELKESVLQHFNG